MLKLYKPFFYSVMFFDVDKKFSYERNTFEIEYETERKNNWKFSGEG